MRAVHVRRFGGPEVLEVVDVPAPDRAGPGQLLTQVEASSVGPWDVAAVAGRHGNLGVPFVPGSDLAGRVLAVGPGVTGFTPNDLVWAYPGRTGGWQEVVAVPASTASLRPRSVSAPDAAGMPHAAAAAYHALVDMLHLTPSQTLLITGAASPLGSLGVQLAAWVGARVIATAPAEHHEWLGGLGATDVLGSGGPWLAQLRDLAYDGVDAVLDLVGGEVMVEAAYGVRDGGRIVTMVARSDEPVLPRAVRWQWCPGQGSSARLRTVAGLVDTGAVQPQTSAVYPVQDVRKALSAQSIPHRGALVLSLG